MHQGTAAKIAVRLPQMGCCLLQGYLMTVKELVGTEPVHEWARDTWRATAPAATDPMSGRLSGVTLQVRNAVIRVSWAHRTTEQHMPTPFFSLCTR